MIKIKKINPDYLILLWGLILSGNPGITNAPIIDNILISTSFILFFYRFTYIKNCLKKCSWIFLLFFIIFVIQMIHFEKTNIATYIGFSLRLFIGFVIVTTIDNFLEKYIRIICVLILISFLFYIPTLIFPSFPKLFNSLALLFNHTGSHRVSILFNTFTGYRNSGFFWEPGAFSGYIILAILFYFYVNLKDNSNLNKKYLYILIIGELTTLSTTGFLCLFIIIFYFLFSTKKIKNKIINIIFFIPLFLYLSITIFYSEDFLFNKINQQYEMSISRETQYQWTRIGTLLFDFDYIKARPITGWGIHSSTRYSKQIGDEYWANGMGNGMSNFIASFGVIMFIIYIFNINKGLKIYFSSNIKNRLMIIFVIIITLQGEVFLGYPIFLGLFFLPYMKKEVSYNNNYVINNKIVI